MFAVRSRRLVSSVSNILRLSHIVFGDNYNSQNTHVMKKTFDKTVDPYSKIYIETPMHVRILPVDLNTHPNGDRLIVTLFVADKDGSSEFSIKQTTKRVDVIGKNASPDVDAVCIINAPIRASFDIKALGKSSIMIDKMHSDDCNLKTASGAVTVKDVRGRNMVIRSDEGTVQCEGTLQAENIDIRTEAGADVICQHLRSNSLKISTHGGNISTESCYSEESNFTTVVGSMKLANLHRKCVVEILEHGELTMTGFDGTLKAILKRGNVRLQASKLYDKNSIFVHESGLVDVRISDAIKDMSLIELMAKKLNIEEEILKHGKMLDDPLHGKFRYEDEQVKELHNELCVDCRNGSIDIKMSSWKQMLEEKGITSVK